MRAVMTLDYYARVRPEPQSPRAQPPSQQVNLLTHSERQSWSILRTVTPADGSDVLLKGPMSDVEEAFAAVDIEAHSRPRPWSERMDLAAYATVPGLTAEQFRTTAADSKTGCP